ncbi:MAG: GTPase HflX, partial [Deltaproteobacteria bacterium]|nr:GTPase HflX [Deltaproteobacteria bacterium]
PEIARYLSDISHEIKRQVGILVNRKGIVEYVIVGDHQGIVIPPLERYRGGLIRLRGLRCIHTHLRDEPLTQDDITDLALLRLDMMGALSVDGSGSPGRIYLGHLLPENHLGKRWELLSPHRPWNLDIDFLDFIQSLEDEFQRTQRAKALENGRENALLVTVVDSGQQDIEESVRELKELLKTSGGVTVDSMIQRPKRLHPRLLIGRGKLTEIAIRCMQLGVDLIIFNRDLSPAQMASISDFTGLRVIDRTQLILDIFAQRAHSRDGKLQVELAQLRYLLPRLTGKNTAMSRLTGGIGRRGPGETKLEINRRRVRDRIVRLERELKNLDKRRKQRRERRIKRGIPILSIVGYTNAGKSTLFNALTKSHANVEQKLFATLDTATRRLRFQGDREVIISDTVGFIRDLPKDLRGAFRATLDELNDADLLIHLVDLSTPGFEGHILAVETILNELELNTIPKLLVFNKEDKVDSSFISQSCRRYNAISISAFKEKKLDSLVSKIEEALEGYRSSQ